MAHDDEVRRRRDRSEGGEEFFRPSSDRTVVVPESLRPDFDRAQATVADYFKSAHADPSRGMISIGDQRYVLIRASALSFDFLESIRQLYADRDEREADGIGRSFLYDMAHTIGRNDARAFHARMQLSDPVAKLAAGPVHFAFTGWALVEIDPASAPAPGDDYLLVYDHPYSFEADSWLRRERRAPEPVCIMSAGYSSGWCEASFGVELTAVEVSCRARGDDTCTFVMAPPSRIAERVAEQVETRASDRVPAEIPRYFERKQQEEQRSRFIERIINAQDEERRAIARELHDELGALLTSLGMVLHGVDVDPAVADQTAASIGRAQELADLALSSVRRLARGLHPSLLDDLGFVAALERYISEFAEDHNVDVVLQTNGLRSPTAIPRHVRIALYRIVQECLTNAVKHGGPDQISVTITRDGGVLRAVVEDDGVGFDSASGGASKGARGIGLHGIRERAALLKGSVEIEAEPGRGCTVAVRVPLSGF